jgi:DNA-binding transcriptional ArsR family regulator
MARANDAAIQLARDAPIFAALGDRTRLRILSRLSEGRPLSITRLTDGARISRQAVTKHLHALAGVGLVASQRAGRERIWLLQPRRIEEVRRHLAAISRQWDDAIERLRVFVERDAE